MTSISAPGFTTALLGLAGVTLAALIATRLVGGTQTAALLATPARPAIVPATSLDAPAIENHLEPLRDRALFYASRAFYVPPRAPTLPSVPPRPSYELAGTFIIPRKPSVAFLRPGASGGVPRKVKAGDDVDGWTVESVEASRVLLRFQDERAEIQRAAPAGASHGLIVKAPFERAPAQGAAVVADGTVGLPVRAAAPVRPLGRGGSAPVIRDASLADSRVEPRPYVPPRK